MKFLADTHALIWHLLGNTKLSTEAKRPFEKADRGEAVIFISTISLAEIIYLKDRNRIPENFFMALRQILSMGKDRSYQTVDLSADIAWSMERIPREKIPELPDRIIAATALHLNVPLITKDHRLQDWEGIVTVW